MDRDLLKKKIAEVVKASTDIMIDRNTKRGDAWRGSGLLGNFIDIHTRYSRLKKLIWDQGLPCDSSTINTTEQLDIWLEQVVDTLRDIRNFTILAEFNIIEENWKGDPEFTKLGKYMGKECDTNGVEI